jgi:hypothetical protein
MKVFWLTPEQIAYALIIGVIVGVCISFSGSAPRPVEVPVQVITPVPTPAPVIITEKPTPLPTPEVTVVQDPNRVVTILPQTMACVISQMFGGNFYILLIVAVMFNVYLMFGIRSGGMTYVVMVLMMLFMIWIFNPFAAVSDTMCNQTMVIPP